MAVKKSIKDTSWPVTSKEYQTAHNYANKMEKKKYGKQYNELKKVQNYLLHKHPHQLLGDNTKTGKLLVNKEVPPKFRAEVLYHERMEHKKIKELIAKKKGKKNG